MENNFNQLPPDVAEVYAWMMFKQPVGAETYRKSVQTIKDYPKYFPWEHLYKSIPQEVHDAYTKEAGGDWDWDNIIYKDEKGESIGLIPSILKREQENIAKSKEIAETPISILEIMKDLFAQQEKERIARIEQQKKDKEIWDKHYSKYGLKYSEYPHFL